MVNLEFKPSVKQHQAWAYLTDNTTNFIGYGGAAFGGKSYLLCKWITIMSLSYPDTAWGLGRKELVTLKRTTLLTLFKVFKEAGLKNIEHYNYNQQLNVITFFNGSQIFLIDTAYKPSDPLYTRFGGYELTSCAIDESAETDYNAIQILFTRTGRRNNHKYGIKRKILETFNPAKNHVYKRYYNRYKENCLPKSYAFVPALPKDNPSPEAEEYISGILDNADEVTIQRLIHGNFEYDDKSALIFYDSIVDYWNGQHIHGNGETFLTIDVARKGKDKTIFRVWNGWVCIKRVAMDVSLINEIVDRARRLQYEYGILNSKTIVDEDGVGGGVVDYLKCQGFVNNSRALYGENYDNLKSQCSIKMAKKINLREVVEICDDSSVMDIVSEEMEQIKLKDIDKDGKMSLVPKDHMKANIGRSPDDWDSIMMRMWFELTDASLNVKVS